MEGFGVGEPLVLRQAQDERNNKGGSRPAPTMVFWGKGKRDAPPYQYSPVEGEEGAYIMRAMILSDCSLVIPRERKPRGPPSFKTGS